MPTMQVLFLNFILSCNFITNIFFIFFSEDLNIVTYEYKQGANPTRIQEWKVKGFESKQKQVWFF